MKNPKNRCYILWVEPALCYKPFCFLCFLWSILYVWGQTESGYFIFGFEIVLFSCILTSWDYLARMERFNRVFADLSWCFHERVQCITAYLSAYLYFVVGIFRVYKKMLQNSLNVSWLQYGSWVCTHFVLSAFGLRS